jgi:hypothetical protein
MKNIKEIIIEVLSKNNKPMHSKDIAKFIVENNLYPTKGKTFDLTIASLIYMENKQLKSKSRFAQTAPGIFGLNSEIYKNFGTDLSGADAYTEKEISSIDVSLAKLGLPKYGNQLSFIEKAKNFLLNLLKLSA